jgi:APA family basic amino acid/polyamine antiporter
LSYKHPKTDAMIPGLTAFAIVAIVVAFFGKGVDKVLNFSIFLDCIGFVTSAAALFILRKRNQGNESIKGFTKHITPYLTVLFVLAYLVVATAVVIDDHDAAITGVILMVVFFLLYFAFYHKRERVL